MSTITANELERRRQLAVQRVREGHSQAEVARFFDVSRSAVCKWVKAAKKGERGLLAKPGRGRPAKLSKQQERQVLRWFHKPATDFGFPNEWWTAPRVAEVIRRTWKVRFHPRYLNQWLSERCVTSQKPARQPRERNDQTIRHWIRYNYPHIQNERESCARILY